ncbi:hypothetical protein QKW52_05165 [Bacillus sonorensis]|nr:hypothetical protein [Bacillus sonorensis]
MEYGSPEEEFKYLEDKGLYADIEELALDAAEYYNEIGKLEESIQFYRKAIQAKNMNKRGVDYDEKQNSARFYFVFFGCISSDFDYICSPIRLLPNRRKNDYVIINQ